jgi:hypothetical protein
MVDWGMGVEYGGWRVSGLDEFSTREIWNFACRISIASMIWVVWCRRFVSQMLFEGDVARVTGDFEVGTFVGALFAA